MPLLPQYLCASAIYCFDLTFVVLQTAIKNQIFRSAFYVILLLLLEFCVSNKNDVRNNFWVKRFFIFLSRNNKKVNRVWIERRFADIPRGGLLSGKENSKLDCGMSFCGVERVRECKILNTFFFIKKLPVKFKKKSLRLRFKKKIFRIFLFIIHYKDHLLANLLHQKTWIVTLQTLDKGNHTIKCGSKACLRIFSVFRKILMDRKYLLRNKLNRH